MRYRLPWVLALPLAFAGSWLAHVVGRSLSVGPAEGAEAAEHLERIASAHRGSAPMGVSAVLAPFLAIAVVVLAARFWAWMRRRSWRGAGPAWFLILPAAAYLSGELLERLMNGGSAALGIHVAHEPGFVLALALQVPFGAVACAIALLLLAAARAIVAKVRASRPAERPRSADVEPIVQIAPVRWSCLVGAHGVRGPPVALPS